MTYFGDPRHAAEAADEDRTEQIATWLNRHDVRPHTEFFAVVDDALYAEDDAKVFGTYPPLGHGYPREDHQ
ncbi:hypothetical protein [Streptomyces sp. MK37H]|uniref:hypothetical protein n=1 Tax=Streptomyces sp. MK37H TaxID=2699117 RepID=UPI001B37D4D1|nr:hypothetical protein [Streptomyces sp. MK37H]MBP8533084.1 hypothetical protein [Streptomyces sp. MK37H]